MLGDGRLGLAKGLVAALMRIAARDQARIVLICFAGNRIERRVGPSRPGAWRDDWVSPIAAGGGTRIGPALVFANTVLAGHGRRHPADRRHLWLLTDGRSPESPARPPAADAIHLVDFDSGRAALHRLRRWARAWQAGLAWPGGRPSIRYGRATELADSLAPLCPL